MPTTASSPKWISSSSMPVTTPNLLLIDDDRIMRIMLGEALQQQGYTIQLADSAESGLAILVEDSARIDALILDRELPGMNGLDLAKKMKLDPQLSAIPIIMLTGSGQQEAIQQGIDAGVHYYLVKPTENTLLKSVVESALRERRQKKALIAELNRHGAALKAMKHCQISVRSLAEAEDTACFLASCFPDPERVVAGLMELLVNAVEHGNFGITYEQKNKLLSQGNWRNELERLSALPENAAKTVDVTYQHKEEGFFVQITDTGEGFDWKRYWHINPARATASHGRGIARARLMAFDRMAYNEKGNSVTVMVAEPSTTGPQQGYAW